MNSPRFYVHEPEVMLRARVNLPAATYPTMDIPFDGVTEGNPGLILPGMTVYVGTAAGLSNRGRQRVKQMVFPDWPDTSSGVIRVGRSSEGTEDGELTLTDDAYITVLADVRVWSKISHITPEGVIYKDGDEAVGTNTSQSPPVANAGPPAIGTIDAVDEFLTVTLPPTTGRTFATAPGATIVGYLWLLPPSGVALASGSNLTDEQITVEAQPGFHWLRLQVEDSNGKYHLAWVWILALDPDEPVDVAAFEITRHTIAADGQMLGVRVWSPLSAFDYPEGTLCALWEGEPSGPTDRSNVTFWGWAGQEPAQIEAARAGVSSAVELQCLDVAGRLMQLPGFSVSLMSDAERDTAQEPGITWSYMPSPNMDRFLHYLLQWHSNALELADWQWSGTGADYPFVVLEAGGDSLWDQVARKCRSFVPDYHLTCDRRGQLWVKIDPLIQNGDDRTATVQQHFGSDRWQALRYSRRRSPEVHWLRESAVKAVAALETGPDGRPYLPTFFAVAPGDTPGQGLREDVHGEQLARSQSDLNIAAGNRYARGNARQSQFEMSLVNPADADAIEPAYLEWITVNLPADVAAQRGMTLSTARGLPLELNIGYNAGAGGLVKMATVRWELETAGRPAVTWYPPGVEPVDDGNDYWPAPAPAPEVGPFDSGLVEGVGTVAMFASSNYFNDATGDVAIYRTTNFQSSPPTWDRKVLSGIDRKPLSFVVDPFSPGYRTVPGGAINGFFVDGVKVYKVTDMFGATPAVTTLHTFPVAFDNTYPRQGRQIMASFGRFFEDEADNPWLMVASYYSNHPSHTGVWITYSIDGGQTWSSEVQVTSHHENGAPFASHHTRITPAVYLSPKQWGKAYVTAFTTSGTGSTAPESDVYVTADWGATWSLDTGLGWATERGLSGSLHVPWDDNDDELLAYYSRATGSLGSGQRFWTYRNGSDITAVASGGNYGPNQGQFSIRAYDSDRQYMAMAGKAYVSFNNYVASFVSNNGGTTWTNVIAPQLLGGVLEIAFAGDNPDILYAWGGTLPSSSQAVIQYSSNFGASWENKYGNIDSLSGAIYAAPVIGIVGGPTA